MKAEQVVEKILSEARGQAESLLSEARSKIEARQQALQAEMDEYAKQTEALAQEAAEDKQARMLASARMDLQKKKLAAKVDLLNKVFEKARERINSLPDGEYQDLMSRRMIEATSTGDEEVITGRQETRIGHDLIKQVNKKLGPGFKGNLRLSGEKADIEGGFLLRRGRVQINGSTDVLIAQVRERMEAELIEDLFTE